MKETLIKLIFLIVAIVTLASNASNASEVKRIGPNTQKTALILKQVSDVLNSDYVYPEVANEMSTFLEQQMAQGRYASAPTLNDLIEKIEKDLRKISNDGHLSLRLASAAPDRADHVIPKTEEQREIKVQVLSGNDAQKIGYLKFNKFAGDAETKGQLTKAMKTLSETDSLIIDLRDNIGGDPRLVAYLSSYFLDANTHLWSVYNRNDEEVIKASSTQNDNRYSGKLAILTSHKTYSAAEAFTYTMKHLDRATVIGETTGGGAHLVEMRPVNDEIDIRIPSARAYNPITKSNWEVVGVVPSINVDPSEAVDAAIEFLRD